MENYIVHKDELGPTGIERIRMALERDARDKGVADLVSYEFNKLRSIDGVEVLTSRWFVE